MRKAPVAAGRKLSPHVALLLGGGVGFGSTLTGTGGPILLLPALTLLRVHALNAVGSSQIVQTPLALFAALGFWISGTLDLRLGLPLGVVQGVGVVLLLTAGFFGCGASGGGFSWRRG